MFTIEIVKGHEATWKPNCFILHKAKMQTENATFKIWTIRWPRSALNAKFSICGHRICTIIIIIITKSVGNYTEISYIIYMSNKLF